MARPDGFDLRAHVEARRRVPDGLDGLSDEDGRVVLRVGADELDGMARVLASLGLDVTVRKPAAPRTALTALADRLAASATRTP